jgi:hypothetical protein
MSKEMAVIVLGVWVVILPYLGIYRSWLTVLLVITGVALMIMGFLMRGEKIAEEHRNGHNDSKHKKSRMPFEQNTATVEQDYSNTTQA